MADLLSGHTCLLCGGHITPSGCFCDEDDWSDDGTDEVPLSVARVQAIPAPTLEDTSSEDGHACEFCDGEGGWNE